MKTIRKMGVIVLCVIMFGGFLMVSTMVFCYGLRKQGIENQFVIWFTQNASIDFTWKSYLKEEASNDINTIQRYKYIVEGMEGSIEEFCTSAFPYSDKIKNIADVYKNDVLNNSLSATVGGKTDAEYAQEAAKYVNSFYDYLQEKDIPLVYIQLPEKERILAYSQQTDYPSAELALEDLFARQREKSNVEYINMGDFTEELATFSLDASNHWFPKDALTTTSIIAMYLNEKHGFEFDKKVYNIENYKNVFQEVNGLNKKIKEDFKYDYQLLVPKKSETYNVEIDKEEKVVGNFEDALLVDSSIWDSRTDTNSAIAYHATWRLNNGNYIDIVNTSGTNNEDKKILILGDSFSWPISAYLSQDVGEIVAFHPRYCSADVKAVINEYQPDIVLWMYSEVQMGADNDLNYGWVER